VESSRGSLPGQPGEGRLTEQERKLVARLLSDPTYFPIEFRSWLKNFLESSDIFGKRDGGGSGVKTGLPAGIIIGIPSMTIPTDTLSCDGSVKNRTTYAKLFTILGTAWGAGDGSTTFNLPDFRDRSLFGVGSRVGLAQTDGLALGSRGGPSHHHSGSALQTSVVGNHFHADAGDHIHAAANNHRHGTGAGNFFATTGFATFPEGNQVTTRIAVAGGISETADGGYHQHDSAGNHNHGGAGQHQHGVSGDTSGGFDQDEPSWAGIVWAITTGV
jgi:microcystin-dependent protein